MTVKNLELLEAVRDQIVQHPELHDQYTYGLRNACRTTRCAAGWTLANSDRFELVWLIAPGRCGYAGVSHAVDSDGTEWEVDEAAQALLGLNDDEAGWLFHNYKSHVNTVKYLDVLIQQARDQQAVSHA